MWSVIFEALSNNAQGFSAVVALVLRPLGAYYTTKLFAHFYGNMGHMWAKRCSQKLSAHYFSSKLELRHLRMRRIQMGEQFPSVGSYQVEEISSYRPVPTFSMNGNSIAVDTGVSFIYPFHDVVIMTI